MIYTGIGSRNISIGVSKKIREIGEILALEGLTLRSGHASGSDIAFESGCNRKNGKKEIYLPWKGFNGSDSNLILQPNSIAFEIAKTYHPNWNNLNLEAKKFHARNSYQILGYELNKPSNFVICYTSKGTGKGGTGQALRLAQVYNIPILDLGVCDTLLDIDYLFNKFMYNLLNK